MEKPPAAAVPLVWTSLIPFLPVMMRQYHNQMFILEKRERGNVIQMESISAQVDFSRNVKKVL